MMIEEQQQQLPFPTPALSLAETRYERFVEAPRRAGRDPVWDALMTEAVERGPRWGSDRVTRNYRSIAGRRHEHTG